MRRIVVGISGASGAVYAQGVIRALVAADVEVHLVISTWGRRLLRDELGMEQVNLEGLARRGDHGIILYNNNDVGAAIASGSFLHDGMIIVPASSNALASVANGLGDNLLYRAAAVTLKERRRLILCHREMPLSHIDIENMRRLSLAGGIIAPANPGWYLLPQSTQDLADFVVARLLDLLGVEHAVGKRWGEGARAS
ncbi:MAG: UbiX family flavin prenyltransferase [Phycisphaerales bacterium]|nr:UbiX family flavin prenyltransferase [Phycisphaerales bacterium]